MDSESTNEANPLFDTHDDSPIPIDQSHTSTAHLPSTLRRRSFSSAGVSSKELGDSLPEISAIDDPSKIGSGDPSSNLYHDLEPNEETSEIAESIPDGRLNSTHVIVEKNDDESTLTTAGNDGLIDRDPSPVESNNEVNQLFDDDNPIVIDQSDPSTALLPYTLRRRTFSRADVSSKKLGDSLPETSTMDDPSKTGSRDPSSNLYHDWKPNEETSEITESIPDGLNSTHVIAEKSEDESTLTSARNDGLVDRDPSSAADSGTELSESLHSSSSLLLFIAGLVTNAIGFQLSLLLCFITIPLSVLGCCDKVIVDPIQALRKSRANTITRVLDVWNSTCGYFSPMNEWLNLKDPGSIWNLVFRIGWGLLRAIYVGCVLCGLLLTSILISGVLMRYLVEEPLEIKEMLNFDYTKTSPVVHVPIVSCDAVGCGAKCTEKIVIGKNVGSRAIPRDHKLQLTVSLTLPESTYNRRLGMFQVRVDFLSVNGDTLASSSNPCMLKFRSEPIHLLLTFFKLAPLVTGYMSETQTLNLKIRGLKEGIVPTGCLRVVLEQRAEYRPGAGIPEIYDAFLSLESELPFVKRMIRSWKRTIFIWVSMTLFTMELLFTLVCCGALLVPRTRTRDGFGSSRSTENSWRTHV
ncbi:NOD26-like intrinsic protein 1,2 isoform 1 [Hibiscus syriacus]|uniref:NOD26-like intrinsic protein 1,2 isoform 1 n=1 Tax=Hibiscus syriacus TaxID=106335 RepID=A0A6A3BDF2_HIBSY|nr:seipin-2-like [Hibiscus syriacus]KAE8715016.1 NOD26-like intrinsic protein 1,2 isoform 1 [Hibiscus syriacus]